MCGARSGLVGTFTDNVDFRQPGEDGGDDENAHGIERLLRQGADSADLSLYESDIILEESRRIGLVWL
jgi:hypothetical protein